jgi:hypothetical protein
LGLTAPPSEAEWILSGPHTVLETLLHHAALDEYVDQVAEQRSAAPANFILVDEPPGWFRRRFGRR